MKRKYSTRELAQLYDKKDWPALWKIMEPMVKHAVRRCMQEGLDPYYVREDMMQEAYLAAWEALPRWNAFEGSLQTWVMSNVRGAVLHANTRESTGMVGGRDNGGYVVSMHGEAPDEDNSSDDEQGIANAPESWIVYKDPPEGLGDPSEEIDDLTEDMLLQVPAKHRDMVRRLCGIGAPKETHSEYAAAEGIHRDTVEKRLASIRKRTSTKSRKLGNHTMRAA